jgi:DNA-binding NtrC family response regulator
MLGAAGMKVTMASGGEETLSIVEQSDKGEFDLVLSDVVMPRMGGEELVRRLHNLRPGLRFLLMSGYPDSADLRNSSEMSLDVLMKPFTAEELIAKACLVLERDLGRNT